MFCMAMKRTTTMFTTTLGIAILLIVAIAVPMELGQTADAVKAKGVSNSQYGEATKDKVCGDRLCSEVSPEETRDVSSSTGSSDSDKGKHIGDSDKGKHIGDSDKGKHIGGESSHEGKEKMKQKHLQMLEKMKSMNKMEMIDSMKYMMSEHHDMKIEKMSQMDRPKLLENIEKMLDKMSKDEHSDSDMTDDMSHNDEPLYNEVLNPRQIDYPNTLGFSDLHIHAIRHLDVNQSHGTDDHLLQTIVHHHCKVYDDNTAACLLFPYGMTDQDKPYGIEYVITADQYQELSDEEKPLWHYHKTEFPRAQATFPELTDEELAKVQPILDETYGKVVYFWNVGDTYPIGEPYVLVVQEIPDQ